MNILMYVRLELNLFLIFSNKILLIKLAMSTLSLTGTSFNIILKVPENDHNFCSKGVYYGFG